MSEVFAHSKAKPAYGVVSGFMLNDMINCDNHFFAELSC
jgi:hypothetical protein